MKKWLCALSICAVTGLGAFGFAGCGNGDDVASISIKTIPSATFWVGDEVTPTLQDGVFTVTYKNGRTSDLPMSAADLVYVDYGDNTTSNKFLIEANSQNVVVRYKSKTDSYGVKVSKRNLNLTPESTYTTEYDGSQKSASDVLNLGLPDGVSISKIEYKSRANSPAIADFTTDAPRNAGEYDLRISLNGGAQYNDAVLGNILYKITKTDVSFALKNAVKLNDIYTQYGDAVSLNNNWTIDANGTQGYFSTALKSDFSSIAGSIKYAYKADTESEFTTLSAVDGKYYLDTLTPGKYTLRAYANNLENFNDFAYESVAVVSARTLVYGSDYKIYFEQGAQRYEYNTMTAWDEFKTNISTTDPASVTVRVEFLSDIAKNSLSGTAQIFFQYSQSNNANWGGEMSAMQNYGYYKINLSAQFKGNVCTFGDTILGVQISAPAGD